MITITTYTGNLVAFLAVPEIEAPTNTIDDLIDRGSWGLLSGSDIDRYLNVSILILAGSFFISYIHP